MKSWTPLWSTIVGSTLWAESKDVRILFVSMMAVKDAEGEIHMTMSGLSRMANLTHEECVAAVKVLESPDPRSETLQEFEGRRLMRIDGGWKIINHHKYRDMIKIERRRAYQNRWAREDRERKRLAKMNSGTPLPGEVSYVKVLEERGPEAADATL